MPSVVSVWGNVVRLSLNDATQKECEKQSKEDFWGAVFEHWVTRGVNLESHNIGSKIVTATIRQSVWAAERRITDICELNDNSTVNNTFVVRIDIEPGCRRKAN